MDEELDRALKDLPLREVDPMLSERVRRLGQRALTPPARALPLAAAVVSFVYLSWALLYAGALYR
jgi:hypothetical protein